MFELCPLCDGEPTARAGGAEGGARRHGCRHRGQGYGLGLHGGRWRRHLRIAASVTWHGAKTQAGSGRRHGRRHQATVLGLNCGVPVLEGNCASCGAAVWLLVDYPYGLWTFTVLAVAALSHSGSGAWRVATCPQRMHANTNVSRHGGLAGVVLICLMG